MEVVYFIVLVGVLIFVHELGHFICAKFFGVRVLKFSLGFGPKIAGFARNGTEYVIAALPLGGYVRMLGESPYDRVADADEGRAFSQQPLWKRTIIVIAGPAMNLLFPIALFFVVFLGDAETTPAVIGTVYPDNPADGVLLPGDRVIRADGEEISTFYELKELIAARPNREIELVVQRGGDEQSVVVTPYLAQSPRPLDLVEEVGRIGIKPHHPLAVIGVTSPSSPAGAAHLRSFDRVVQAGTMPVNRWIDLEAAVAGYRDSTLPIGYLRPVRVEGALGGLAEFEIYEPHVTMVTPEPGPGDPLTRAGLEPADLYLSHVSLHSGARSRAVDLRRGDRLVSVDGRRVRLWAAMLEQLEEEPDRVHELVWRRGDQLITRRYRMRASAAFTEEAFDLRVRILDPDDPDRHLATIGQWHPTVFDDPVPMPSPVLYAADEALRATGELVELVSYSIVRLLQRRLSVETIGGPLRMFEATAEASREGALPYLSLMAFISINLGLINLMPIPMLDGGHLLFFFLEAIGRRPVSTKIREYASVVGLVLIGLLMILAFKNDIERQWPVIVQAFQSD